MLIEIVEPNDKSAARTEAHVLRRVSASELNTGDRIFVELVVGAHPKLDADPKLDALLTHPSTVVHRRFRIEQPPILFLFDIKMSDGQTYAWYGSNGPEAALDFIRSHKTYRPTDVSSVKRNPG